LVVIFALGVLNSPKGVNMILKVPVTGTVIELNPDLYRIDKIGISGDPNDPVRLINVDLGDVSWRLVSIDLENDLAEIEVQPAEKKSVLKPGGDPGKDEDYIEVPTTAQDKQQLLDNARQSVEGKTPDELYSLTKSARLIKSANVMMKLEETIAQSSRKAS